MPKEKVVQSIAYRQWSQLDSGLTTDGRLIFCRVCSKQVKCAKKFQVIQHINTANHIRNKNAKKLQTTLKIELTEETFSEDLCKAMVAANIPWCKLNNIEFRSFLFKYCQRTIPNESTLRKNYQRKLNVKPVKDESDHNECSTCNIMNTTYNAKDSSWAKMYKKHLENDDYLVHRLDDHENVEKIEIDVDTANFINPNEEDNEVSENSNGTDLNTTETCSDSHNVSNGTSSSINGRDARLLAITATFLNVHPFGVDLSSIWSYLTNIDSNLKLTDVEGLLRSFPTTFKEIVDTGPNVERKWIFNAFNFS